MARGKKPVAKAKRTSGTQSTARGKAKAQGHDHAKMSADIKTQTAQIKLLKGNDLHRRPPNNPDMPQEIIDNLNTDFNSIKELLDNFSQHLRALDRMRLNGVGIKKLGFVERAYELALENSEFLPHYLTLERFGRDIQYFMDFRSLTDLVTQIREKLWNITIQSADIAYTDALEFYASVREAAKRRVDAAESIHNALSPFFKRHRSLTDHETEKQELRDAKSLIHGKHDGKLIIENIQPKLTGGKRNIIDETYKDSKKFKDDIEGEVTE
jgi:hypothetical protein